MKKNHLHLVVLLIFAFGECPFTSPAWADFLTANIDATTAPQTDFFQFANGAWIKKNPIPPSESGWGVGELVQEEIYHRILSINEAAERTKNEAGSISQKIGDFWSSAMNTRAIDKAGVAPLKNQLAKIDALRSDQELANVVANLQMDGVHCFFNAAATQDDKESSKMIYEFAQGGLGLPNREYYFLTDARTQKVRAAYQKYLIESFRRLGFNASQAKTAASSVFKLETALAGSSKKLEDLRDPNENYHKMTLQELSKQAPNFDWKNFVTTVGVPNSETFVLVGQPEFLTALSREIKNTPLAVWKDYLRFHLIDSYAPELDRKTFQNYFNYRKNLTGATEPRARWKRMIDEEEGMMGEAVGQLFAKEYFNEVAKKRYNDLVEAIRDAYAERIRHLSWMSDSTKKKALEKLAKISKKVGYPDQWKDFSSLQIQKDSLFTNAVHANHFWHEYNIHKLGKPVDYTEWEMTPQTYNAFYNPSKNEIVLPAGVFTVPAMKDADLDDAFVYGYAAASTIGHEITHGFDDQGRQYDAAGNLAEWWTEKDEKEFKSRAQAIVDQFNEFVPIDKTHVNGAATEGENIADLGGLVIGIDAFKKTAQYQSGKKIAGFTPMQRYFLGYAYGWLYEETNEKLATQLLTDFHAPAKERVNGPMMNIPEFYEAFGVKKGDKMYREESKRVSIW